MPDHATRSVATLLWLAASWTALNLLPHRAAACASCAVGDPTITDLAMSQPARGRRRAALDLRHRSLRVGHAERGFRLAEQRLALRGMYSPWAQLSLQAELPFVRRVVTRPNAARERSLSLGDARLGAQALLFRDRVLGPAHALWLGLGCLLPSAPALREDGQTLPLERQTGRGAFAPRATLRYARFAARLALFASVEASVPLRGFARSRASRALTAQLTGQVQPTPWLALRGGARHLWEGRAYEEGGTLDPDSGGQLLAFEAGVSVRAWDNLVLRGGLVWPALQWLRGQHREGAVWSAGVLGDF